MKISQIKNSTSQLIILLALFAFLSVDYIVDSCVAGEIKGIKLSSKEKYQTSLSTLNSGFLLQNGNRMGTGPSGNLIIIFGLIHIGSDEATALGSNVEIFEGKTNLSPNITLLQDRKSGKWLATNGTMCIDNGTIKVLDNSTIRIIGGTENPVKIEGRPFSDTTIVIKNGKPTIIKSADTNVERASSSLVIIKGVITNLEKAKEYITNDSYLQLVFLPSDGNIAGETDSRGRMKYNSKLDKIEIPPTGVFTFKVTSLKPGRYLIAAQLLEPFGLGRGGSPLLGIKKTKKFAIIDIPEETKKPVNIDLGEVIIPVP
jgi:hypothetical protein